MFFNVTKDPSAVLDYSIDWTAWLQGDTILESTWTAATGSGLEVASSSISTDGMKATAWISRGTVGASAGVMNHITTAAGRQDSRTILVKVEDK